MAYGHQVSVISAKAYYPYWKISDDHAKQGVLISNEHGVTVHRVPLYVPVVPTGAKRLIHHLSFVLRAFPEALRLARQQNFDAIFCVAPSLLSVVIARAIARLQNIPLWLHIQDFEVEAAFATGLLKPAGLVARLARAFENWSLRAARVSTISPQMCEKLRQAGVPHDRIVEFRNWANINDVRPLMRDSLFRQELGIGERHVALYSGNLGNKQGIEIIVEAARRLQHRQDLIFLVCGDGSSKERLVTAAAGLENVMFVGLQPREALNELLGLASVHLLPQLAGAADLVLPSKLTNMLASGRAVVATADEGTGLAAEVEGCGLVTPPEDADQFASAIERIIDSPAMQEAFGHNARQRAEERWSKDSIISEFEKKFTDMCQK